MNSHFKTFSVKPLKEAEKRNKFFRMAFNKKDIKNFREVDTFQNLTILQERNGQRWLLNHNFDHVYQIVNDTIRQIGR